MSEPDVLVRVVWIAISERAPTVLRVYRLVTVQPPALPVHVALEGDSRVGDVALKLLFPVLLLATLPPAHAR